MNNFKIKEIKLETYWGSMIGPCITEAVNISRVQRAILSFEFNGVEIRIDPENPMETEGYYQKYLIDLKEGVRE